MAVRVSTSVGIIARASFFAVVCTLAAGGCAPGRPQMVKVSGRVLLDGKALPGGKVLFLPAGPRAEVAAAQLDESGTYSVTLPLGEVMVAVDNRSLKPPPPVTHTPTALAHMKPEAAAKMRGSRTVQAKAEGPGKYVEIPDRYYGMETSDLTFKVEGNGDMTHDIELKSR
jgi:hypothetical protein